MKGVGSACDGMSILDSKARVNSRTESQKAGLGGLGGFLYGVRILTLPQDTSLDILGITDVCESFEFLLRNCYFLFIDAFVA